MRPALPIPAPPPHPEARLNAPVTPDTVRQHGLLAEEYERICGLLGRAPNVTELGMFSVMWSEHCSYKNTRPLLRGFPTQKADATAPHQVLVKAGEENAGVVDIGDGWAVAFKIESHNHPSAVEPFEGAATGVGGIIRDIFTMGARPVLLTNSLRFGELDDPKVRRLFRGVVHGIAHYGNCMGIPTVGGDIYFEPCYAGNPLVNALCLGVVRTDRIKRGKATGVGNPVYYVGARTGRDGLGGAAFASKELSDSSHEDRPAVQKGDPFMEKLLLEACLEMMNTPGLVVGIQDLGAAGLTCAASETASRGDSGILLDLDRVPQRETGMNCYEMLLSESQERMLVIAAAGREAELEAIFAKWDLPAARVGHVTDTGLCEVLHRGQVVARIPAKALTDDAPVYTREAVPSPTLALHQGWTPHLLADVNTDLAHEALYRLLGHPTIAQKAWVWRQYDHMVMAGTVVLPGSDAAVVRVRLGDGAPGLDGPPAEKLIAISNDCNGRYVSLNPYRGAQIAVAECLRNLACAGAVPLAMTDNLNFGNPYNPEVYYQLKEAVRGLADACRFFDVPVSGGNVSLYNERSDGGIDPTPTVSIAGLVREPAHVTRQYVNRPGLTLFLLGNFPTELGGSYYLKVVHGLKTGDAPALNLAAELRLHNFLRDRIAAGQVAAAHDLAEGGFLVALAEMLFAPGQTFGAELGFEAVLPGGRLDTLLYGEGQSRALVALEPEHSAAFLKAAFLAGVPAQPLGEVTAEPILRLLINLPEYHLAWDPRELRQRWENAIPEAMARDHVAG